MSRPNGNPDIVDVGRGTRFTSDNQPSYRPGRPRNVFNHLRDEYELSSDDISSLIKHSMSLSIEELERLSTDRTIPALQSAIANAVLNGINEGDLGSVNSLLDRLIGKAVQKSETSVNLSAAPSIAVTIITLLS